MLSELIKYQGAVVSIRANLDGTSGLIGEMDITVGGLSHTIMVQRTTVEGVVSGLEDKYLRHDWTAGVMPIVEIRGGMAEVTQGQAEVIDWDCLFDDCCPSCREHLGGIDVRECPSCHYAWTRENE